MKLSHAIQAITFNVLTKNVSYLEGAPGIGKSSAPFAAAAQNGWDIILLPPAPTIEPVDLRGAMKVITAEDAKGFGLPESSIGTTVAFPPDFLPRKADKTTLVVVDDVPTALPAVQAALFQLLLDRKLGSYTVPENVHFVLTGNRLEDKAGASRTLTALDSRVNRIQVDVSYEDWIEWAVKNDIAEEVIAFHRFNKGQYLWQFDPKKKVNPLPRTWAFLSKKVKLVNEQRKNGTHVPADFEIEWYQGDVGQEAANLFVGFTRIFRELPNPAECLAKPATAQVPTDIGAVLCLTGALSRIVKQDTLKNLLEYLSRLPKEYEVLCLQDAINRCAALKETKAYIKWSLDNKTALLGNSAK